MVLLWQDWNQECVNWHKRGVELEGRCSASRSSLVLTWPLWRFLLWFPNSDPSYRVLTDADRDISFPLLFWSQEMKGIDPPADHTAMLSSCFSWLCKGSLGRCFCRGSPWDHGNVCAASWTMQTQFCPFWEQNIIYDWNSVATEVQGADLSSEMDGLELAHDFQGWTCWFKTLPWWRVQIPINSNMPMYNRGEIISGWNIRIKPNSRGIWWGAAEIVTWKERELWLQGKAPQLPCTASCCHGQRGP